MFSALPSVYHTRNMESLVSSRNNTCNQTHPTKEEAFSQRQSKFSSAPWMKGLKTLFLRFGHSSRYDKRRA